jgi:hypothetical protein
VSASHRTLGDAGLEPSDRRLLEDVRDFGWHVVKIAADDTTAGWAFSVGLSVTFDHPEIVVFGLDVDIMHVMIGNVVHDIRNGARFRHDSRSSEILEGSACAFRAVQPTWYRAFLGYARWFYREDTFACLQCFWPDRHGRLPWDVEFDSTCRPLQPLLYETHRRQAMTENWLVTMGDS